MGVAAEIERLQRRAERQLLGPSGRLSRDERIIELYKDSSLKEVAAAVDMSIEGVRGILMKHGVKIRPPHKSIHRRDASRVVLHTERF